MQVILTCVEVMVYSACVTVLCPDKRLQGAFEAASDPIRRL
jgi:hypothetical protein